MFICRVFSCVVGRRCLLWPVHSLGKTLLAFALLHSAFQGQISCYSRCFLNFYFCIPGPYRTGMKRTCLLMKRTSFLGVSSKRSCRSSQNHSTSASSAALLVGLLWYWVVCLGNEQRSFCHFWDCIQVLHFGLVCWPWWLLHFFWGIPAHSSRYNGDLS